jgi:hypothetical protein
VYVVRRSAKPPTAGCTGLRARGVNFSVATLGFAHHVSRWALGRARWVADEDLARYARLRGEEEPPRPDTAGPS